MDALEALLSRRTVPPVKMAGPGPDEDQLRRILEAGLAAPDHGMLRPFRFVVVRGEGRARLGELFAAAIAAEAPGTSEAELEKHRSGPARAPVIVVVAARLEPGHPKIPEIEQLASAAAATQNILVAAHALGFAAKWATGKPAYAAGVRDGLGLAGNDRIIAILYLGSPAADHPIPPRPTLLEIASDWPPVG